MDVDIIIIGVLSIAFIMLIILRTHVSLMILAGCAGFVLSLLWSPTLFSLLVKYLPKTDTEIIRSYVGIAIFMLPAILVGFHFRSTQSHRWYAQVLPAVFWAVFSATLTVRLLPVSMQQRLESQSQLAFFSQEFFSWIILMAIVVAMIEFMSQRSIFGGRHKKLGRPKKKH
ncbi:hypothetical protein KBC31_02960 [Candidatus Saccharibacteria bacterium]|jgi:hypothetical protein|nr:hypothetical protein [Candidatus Saccharibacteria bacterium]